jgi:hypothetical protein
VPQASCQEKRELPASTNDSVGRPCLQGAVGARHGRGSRSSPIANHKEFCEAFEVTHAASDHDVEMGFLGDWAKGLQISGFLLGGSAMYGFLSDQGACRAKRLNSHSSFIMDVMSLPS